MHDASGLARYCRHCDQVKPLIDFYRDPKKRSKCRECARAQARERSREKAEFLREFKTARGCMDCGYNEHWCALDFDHRPGEIKLHEPAMLKFCKSWDVIHAELAKCDVVCSNCHRIRGFNRAPANLNHDLLRAAEDAMPARYATVNPDQPPLFGLDETA